MWFNEEVVYHRFAFSLMWMLFVQVLIVDGFHFLIKLISWHPWLGIQDWASSLFSLKTIYFHSMLCFSCSVFAVIHMRYHSAEHFIYSNRLQIISAALSPRRIFHWIVHALLGFFNAFCFLKYIGGDGTEKNCLENIFLCETWSEFSFVLCHGLYAGALFSRNYFMNDWYFTKFALKQQKKLPIFWSSVLKVLKESFESSVDGFPMYYIYYVLFCVFGVSKISEFCGFEARFGLSSTFFSLMSIHLLLSVLTLGTLMYFVWLIYVQVFNIFASEHYEFLIEASTESDKEKTLSKALTCSDYKLLQYLAFLDLRLLSQYSPDRRKKFFTISQPGGHPHQWNLLTCICMTLLSQFLNNMKKLSIPVKGAQVKAPLKRIDQTSLDSPVTTYVVKIQEYIKQKPVFKYFFEDFPDTEALRLFTSCQLEIWAIEALGFFLSASYSEDKYGVVQQTLPKILSLLVDLKVCEEKLPLDMMSFKKYAKDSKCLHKGVTQRKILNSSLETTLFRIVRTFRTDIKGIFLPKEYHQYLEKYLQLKK